MKEENRRLLHQWDLHESHSRRSNIFINHGIKEQENEQEDKCIRAVNNFLVIVFEINEDEVKKIEVVRCHCVGPTLKGSAHTAELILCEKTPADTKRSGSVVNSDRQDWDRVKEEIFLYVRRIKFTDDTKMAKLLQAAW